MMRILNAGVGRRLAFVASLVVLLGTLAARTAYAQLTQVPVLTGPSDQRYVAAEGNIIAWSRRGPSNHLFNAFTRIGSGQVRRANPPNTQANVGGLFGDRLIFQQYYFGQTIRSDLRFYNVVTHTYGVMPTGWNTSQFEYSPTLSGRYVLFGRFNERTGQRVILLGNLATKHLTAVASASGSVDDLTPGQVNGNYATWTSCGHVGCDVYEYNIVTARATKISDTFAGGGQQYAPSVTSTGTVYFFHSAGSFSDCGSSVTLNKRVLGQPRAVLVSLAHGLDAFLSYTDDSGGTPVVYYSRVSCPTNETDIYKVVD